MIFAEFSQRAREKTPGGQGGLATTRVNRLGKMDASVYKEYIFGLLFLKRLSDVFALSSFCLGSLGSA
jgi:hypothetical protein